MSGIGTCPRCGQVEELSTDSRSGRPGFWAEPLCRACRVTLGSTTIDKLALVIGWLAMPVEKLLDLADGFHGGQVRQ